MEPGVRVIGRLALVAMAAVACGYALWSWAFQRYQCVASLNEISASLDRVDELHGTELLARAETNLARLRPLRVQCPTEINVPFLIGVNEGLAGRSLKAIEAYEDALTLDRRPEIYIELGHQLLVQGRIEEAVDRYATATRFGANLELPYSPDVLRLVKEKTP